MAMSQEHGSSLQAVQQLMKKNQVRESRAGGSKGSLNLIHNWSLTPVTTLMSTYCGPKKSGGQELDIKHDMQTLVLLPTHLLYGPY